MILLEIKKQKITNMAELTPKKLRGILKKLKLNRYYEHLVHLLSKLTGIDIPHLDPEVEERIRMMFKLVQPAFLKHAPSTRKNFLSYSYILYKFVQLLERDEYLPLFNLLKSRIKLFEQDKVWAKICAELHWQFIPSL
jgi:Poxvirus Late Transcription Factor VLTF3 like